MPPKGKLKDREIEVLSRWVAMGLPWPETKAATPADATASGGTRYRRSSGGSGHFSRSRPSPCRPSATRPGPHRHRPLSAGGSRAERARTRRAGRPAHPDPSGHLRPDRPAADARGDRRVPRRPIAGGVRPGRRSAAGLAALRRALGPALARRRPLRRRPRPDPVARGERLPRGLALSRLGRRRLQPRPAVCGVRPLPGRRRPAAAAATRRDQHGRARRHRPAGHRRLRARRRGQGPDDRRLRQRPDRRRRPGLPRLTVACARCHDHKFDPISTEDYYALAGIFFSTRLIPGPVPGNTPLVRVPLLSPDELAKVQARDAADKRRRAELEQQLPDAADRAYVAFLRSPDRRTDRGVSRGGL